VLSLTKGQKSTVRSTSSTQAAQKSKKQRLKFVEQGLNVFKKEL
jgi:hypothetical protein